MRQAAISVGQQVAGYRVESMVARGGMAVVYRATEVQLARTVALKVLSPDLSDSAEFEQRFMRESQLAASCDHPNIIPIYSAGDADGLLYIAMRFVEGSDLAAVLRREGTVDPSRLLMLFRQVASALDAAHSRRLVHRDVKPGNILVAAGGGREHADHVYLTDFGVTKKSESKSGLTAAGSFVGTLDYISPEQIGGGSIDARTDVYSLGCVIYQALTGNVPFRRDNDAAMLWAHMSERAQPPSHVRPELGPEVDAVLEQAMAKDIADRFPSCRELVDALHTALEHATITDRGRPTVVNPPQAAPPGTSGQASGPRHAGESGPSRPAINWTPPSIRPASRAITQPPAVPHRDTAPPANTGKRRRLHRRRNLLLVVLAVATIAAGAVVLLFRPSSSAHTTKSWNGYHYSTEYPGAWPSPGVHPGGAYAVFSPKGPELRYMFDSSGKGWSVLQQSPESDRVGSYVSVQPGQPQSFGDSDVQTRIGSLAKPDVVTLTGAATNIRVNGQAAVEWTGFMAHGSSNRVLLSFNYIRVTASKSSIFEVIEFGGSAFDSNQKNFDLIVSHLRATG